MISIIIALISRPPAAHVASMRVLGATGTLEGERMDANANGFLSLIVRTEGTTPGADPSAGRGAKHDGPLDITIV